MNTLFKEEFAKLNPEDIKEIINRCSTVVCLQHDITKTLNITDPNNTYFIKYIPDDDYGFWIVEWNYQKIKVGPMPMSTAKFASSVKITPFKIEFENTSGTLTSLDKTHIQDYLQVYINKKCLHYKQAVIEETERFFKKIDPTYNTDNCK